MTPIEAEQRAAFRDALKAKRWLLSPYIRTFTRTGRGPAFGKFSLMVKLSKEEARQYDSGTLSRKRINEIWAEHGLEYR